jgi:predicted permease
METLFQHRMEATRGSRGARFRAWVGIVADSVGGATREWSRLWGERLGGMGEGMGSMMQDVKQAVRGVRRAPGRALIAVVTLALGIGANTTTFSVVDGVLLKPLPFDEPERIVSVWPEANFNVALVREVSDAVPALGSVAGISLWTAVLTGAGDPAEIQAARVSPAYFEVLRVAPALGRTLRPGDDLVDDASVVVLSHDLWMSRFGGDPEAVGRTIQLSVDVHDRHTVVGVMPASFDPPGSAAVWVPLIADPTVAVEDDPTWYVNARIGRLAPGASLDQATEQLRRVATRVAPGVPNQMTPEVVAAAGVVPLLDDMIDQARTALWVLFGAVGLVLLIACANVANLLLARGETRRHDLCIRTALGAGRGRIVRLLLLEALVLGGAGGGLGILTAVGLTDLVVSRVPADIPRIEQVTVDRTVLFFALGVTLTATILSALFPALRNSRAEPVNGLHLGTRGASGRGSSRVVTRGLIAVEVALAAAVALGSGLMLRSLDRLLTVDTGFDPANVVAFRPNPLGSGREGPEAFRQFYSELTERLSAVPGVQSVGAVQILTGTTNNWSFPTYPEGYQIPETGAMPDVNFRAVLPGYFETLRIPLLRGRTIQAGDRADTESVVVVNRAFVDRFWPNEGGLGKTVRVYSTDADPLRIVGVVGNIRQHALYLDPLPEIYVPYLAWPWEMSAWVLARAEQPELVKAQVRRLVDQVDADVPVSAVEDLPAVLDSSAAETRFFTTLLTTFAALGLFLGAIGIYGVTAHSVARRRPELGVRAALGATRFDLVGSALRSGLGSIVLGTGVGVGLGLAGGRLLTSHLYQVAPSDPLTILSVMLLLGAVAVAAMAVPAWRASRVDPAVVLASE